MYPGAFAETTPDKPAIIMASTGHSMSYAALDAEANRISRLLRRCGVEPGDHVAFCLDNHQSFIPIAWGCRYAGAVFTALSSRLQTDEMEYIINNCEAKVFIASHHKSEQAAELAACMPAVHHRFMLDAVIDGWASFEDAVAAEEPNPLAHRIAGHDMLYSSGTTGRPKGVSKPAPSEPLESASHAVSLMQTMLFDQTTDSVYISPAPLYHAAPLRFSMGCHVIGSTLVIMERFDPEGFLDAVNEYKATHTQMVPTMFVRFLKLPPEVRAASDLRSLVSVVHAAAPCPVAVKEQMIEWLGPIIHEYYAGTESNGLVYCNSHDWLAHRGTVGAPINCEVHICDDDGREVPIGEEAGVYFANGGSFEYHGDPQKTAGSHLPNGWSTLGDIGRLDDDGFLYLTDRKAHMIISGGVNIYPQEAENILTMHPAVADVAVFGIPNEDFGEEVKAVVQPAASATAGPQLERELLAYCRSKLADVKCPRSVDFRDELPRHPTGKLYKRLLKDEYKAASALAASAESTP